MIHKELDRHLEMLDEIEAEQREETNRRVEQLMYELEDYISDYITDSEDYRYLKRDDIKRALEGVARRW